MNATDARDAADAMNVSVIGGAGYVGLITGIGLAELGHHVTNVDICADKIEMLRRGSSPVREKGLEELLQKNLGAGRLSFTSDVERGIASAQVVFIAVGTPAKEDGAADLSQIIQVTEDLVKHLQGYKVIAIKSTVPVGTVELVESILRRHKREGEEFDIVSNPEFLREGHGLHDFFHPDRIVIGARSARARQLMHQLYAPLIYRTARSVSDDTPDGATERGDDAVGAPDLVPVIDTDLASAQMIKYASNAFLAARISFINEIAALCERVGADIKEVATGMGYDPRIGRAYLEAGLGFGGPCLEKDLRALIKIAEDNNCPVSLLRAVLERNDQQVREVIAKVKELTGYLLYKKIIAVFGLTFKAHTSDVRNSLSLRVIKQLDHEGAIVRAYDPVALSEARSLRLEATLSEDPYEAVIHADALVILTDWPQFLELDYARIRQLMASPCIVDARNLLDPGQMRAFGFRYRSIGRVSV